MEEREALIALNMTDGIGSVKLNRLIGRFQSAAAVFKADYNELIYTDGIGTEIAHAIRNFDSSLLEKEMAEIKEKNIEILFVTDERYPALLKEIYDPPPVLYKYGQDIPEADLSIGIVGTRASSDYGEEAVQHLIKGMKQSGRRFNIISGMARGIDSVAHHEASQAGIFNAAILGFGLNVIWPPEKHYVAQEIIKNGCLLTEFPLNMIGLKQNFPRRNRVISGMSDGCVIIEAGQRSGALITADCALEQGREVFAVPGNIFSAKSAGTNNLLKQGAKAVTGINDILEEFTPRSRLELFPEIDENAEMPENMNDDEQKIYTVLSAEKKHIDNISIESNIDTVRLNGIMTVMEIKGLVKQLSGKNFVRGR
jgi:DNA processing protein